MNFNKGECVMEKIAVLIPCYNEEKTIKKVVEDWKKELPEATIYVYNNNSTDRTVEIAKEAGAIAVSYTHLDVYKRQVYKKGQNKNETI